MTKAFNLLGEKFGRLTVIARVSNYKNGAARWHCCCECGGETFVSSANLRGGTKSCGCLQVEVSIALRRRRNSKVQDSERWDNLAEFDEWPS
jgi:hypothetical protein